MRHLANSILAGHLVVVSGERYPEVNRDSRFAPPTARRLRAALALKIIQIRRLPPD